MCRKKWGRKRGKGRVRAAPQTESAHWVLCLEAFASLAGGSLMGSPRGGFQ